MIGSKLPRNPDSIIRAAIIDDKRLYLIDSFHASGQIPKHHGQGLFFIIAGDLDD